MFTKINKKMGMTVVELLVVTGVMILIISITFQVFSNLNSEKVLDKETRNLVSIIHQAQSLTLASKDASQYGVHLAPTQVTLFEGATYSSGNTNNVVTILDGAVTISAITLTGGGTDIIFDRLTGTTAEYGTTTLALVASSTTSKNVVIYPSGVVDIH